MATDNSFLKRTSLAALTSLASYLAYQCLRPPNPVNLETAKDHGSKQMWTASFALLTCYRNALLACGLFNAAYILTRGAIFGRLLPIRHSQVNPVVTSWNRTSAIVLTIMALFAALRIQVFHALGKSFTFDLQDPEALITSGVYAWVQHPSYTTLLVTAPAATMWFLRADGALGALLPPGFWRFLQHWQTKFHWFSLAVYVCGIGYRVAVEEEMLRQGFGQEWEEWHARTARFIPYVF